MKFIEVHKSILILISRKLVHKITMSKLSRFKKAPAVKLPKRLPPQSSRFEESDDDDDFVSRPVRTKETTKIISPKSESKRTTPPIEASVSEYFQPPPIKKTDGQLRKKSQLTTGKPKNVPNADKGKNESCRVNKEKTPPNINNANFGSMSNESEPVCSSISKDTESESDKLSEPSLQSSSDNGEETQGKVLCPFCWKKLGDKLNGTTHVKACAKDVPLQRVFEAMKLQEKQIEEWEKLGLEFPGFLSNNNNKRAKNGGTRTKGGDGGRGRKKKVETVTSDPEFQLAVALSMSLHEELENRQSKENQFLIENGLEKEIGLVDVKLKDPVVKTAEKSSSSKRNGDIPAIVSVPISRRRGKKFPLEQTPLHTVDLKTKKDIICERVTKILDESEKDKNQQFYVRDQIPPDTFGVPKRLIQFQDKSTTMWSSAKGAVDIPNESFSVLDLPNPKSTLLKTSISDCTSNGTDAPNTCQSSEDLSCETGSNLINKMCVEKLEENLNKVDLTVTKERLKNSNVSASCPLIKKSSIVLKNLPRLVQDITDMLRLRKNCDLVLYGREEKAIKCHSFMITARCPNLLRDAVQERDGKSFRTVVPLTNFSHKAVKAFLWYIYTGLIDADYDDVLMSELSELAAAYDMELDLTVIDAGQWLNKLPKCNSVEIQTDIIPKQDASIMTESSSRCSVEREIEALADSSASQELFTTFYDNQDVDSPVENKLQTEIIAESSKDKIVLPSDELSIYNSENEDAASGGDLFAYMEKDDELNQPTSSPAQLRQDAEEGDYKSDASFAKKPSEENDFMEELLASPSITQRTKSSEKKRSRSRSVSPLEKNDPEVFYSATQVADILQLRQDGGNLKEYFKKANKKQKLDDSDLDFIFEKNESIRKSDCDYKSVEVKDANGSDVFDKWNDDSILLKVVNDVHFKDSSLASVTPKYNLLKSRRSVSTPNICVESPKTSNLTPIFNQQISDSENDIIDNDPFANACDDSVFANIPDDILMKGKSPETAQTIKSYPGRVDTSKCASQRSLTPLSHTKEKISPRNLSNCEETFSTTSRGTRKCTAANKKTKAKAPPKVKLPSRLPFSKEDTTTNLHLDQVTRENVHGEGTTTPQSARLPDTLGASTSGHSKSPLMNYSLIDTPILKQELKKYGIKPLPRSKAKVLLRHIYKETHK